MDKSNANILFSLLSGVALFLFIAYSAIRTIDSSSQPDNYFVVTQGVDFHDGISNAPTQTTNAQYEQADISIPEYSPHNASYAASSIGSSSEAGRSEYANNSGGSSSTNKSGASVGSNSGVTTLAINAESHQGTTAQDAAGTTSSLTTNGTLSTTGTTQQSVRKSGDGFGGTDIGGDPTGPPIPVGDGLLFLLFLSGIYSLWKSAAKIKQRLTTSYTNLLSLKNKNVRA